MKERYAAFRARLLRINPDVFEAVEMRDAQGVLIGFRYPNVTREVLEKAFPV